MKLTKVFYDGKCGLCSKEINYYKRIAPKNLIGVIGDSACKIPKCSNNKAPIILPNIISATILAVPKGFTVIIVVVT